MTLLLVGLGVTASVFVARVLKRRDAAVTASERRYRLLFERNLAGLYRTTLDGKILDCNSAFARILGYPSREDVLKVSALDLYSDPGDRESFVARLKQQRVLVNFEICLRRRDGSPVWVLANESLIDEPGGDTVMDGSLIDITDRKRAEQQRWHQANHDALTDLPNRVLFNDRLSLAILHAQRRRQSLVVMFLDLDHFKRVNDTLGHSAGDELLVKVADRLRRCIRQDDTVARVGGDEFLLLLNGIGPRAGRGGHGAEDPRRSLAEPFLVQKRELFVEASIGIGMYPGDGADAETLVTNVDTAMYRAKETGPQQLPVLHAEDAGAVAGARGPRVAASGARSHAASSSSTTSRSSACATARSSASRRSSAGATPRRASCRRASSSRSPRTSASSRASANGCFGGPASSSRRGRRAGAPACASP